LAGKGIADTSPLAGRRTEEDSVIAKVVSRALRAIIAASGIGGHFQIGIFFNFLAINVPAPAFADRSPR
jgi:hypothetical protein